MPKSAANVFSALANFCYYVLFGEQRMWLVLQIAAGIVLGWLVIQNWEAIKKHTLKTLSVLLGLAVFAVFAGMIAWGGDAAWNAATAHSDTTHKYLGNAIVAVLMISTCLAVYALVSFLPRLGKHRHVPLDELTKKQRDSYSGALFYIALFGGIFVPIVIDSLMGEQTFGFLSSWSRENGYADTGEVMSGALVAQLLWVPVIARAWWSSRTAAASDTEAA
jgi:hypothetical protein